eukprot:COSAG01_NODE_43211_length_432_cov_0.735736_1_plen_43_part_10
MTDTDGRCDTDTDTYVTAQVHGGVGGGAVSYALGSALLGGLMV